MAVNGQGDENRRQEKGSPQMMRMFEFLALLAEVHEIEVHP